MNSSTYIKVTNKKSDCSDYDRWESGIRTGEQLRHDKLKCKMVIYFDGSGKCPKVEVIQDI